METLDICVASYRILKGNGIDVSVLEFARELAKRHNVTIAVTYADKSVEDMEVLKYKVSLRSGLRTAAGDISKRRFDLISTHYSPFDLVASLTDIPHYLHDPGIPPFGALKGISGKYLWAAVNGGRIVSARSVRCVLPISDYLGGEFRRKYLYKGRMETLPYGIEFPDDVPELDIPYDRYVLYVGRHTPYKGVDTLMKIFGEVKKEIGGNLHLVTIGNCDRGYDRYLDALSKKIGNIHMLGYVPHIWGYYARASVYATCSRWEGQDRPVIEAQYLGVPVITFDNCSHPEVVLHGTLTDSKEEFKDAMVKYLTGDYINRSVQDKLIEQFSTQKMVSRFIDIIKNMNGADD